MEKEYYTIKEYAELKGVSYQAIYKKLNTTLSTFVIEVNGHKVLKKEVLEHSFNPKNFNVEENNFNVKEKKFNVEEEKTNSSSTRVEEELRRINARNEKLIDELREELKEKDKTLQKMSEKVIDLFDTNQRLMENNQKLQLNYQLLLSDNKDAQSDIETNSEVSEINKQGAQAEEEQVKSQPKSSIFKRLFNR